MKFLLHGNAPTIKTGYGTQIAQLAERLRDAGHEVAVSSTYGIQASIEMWRGIRVYGQGFDTQSNDRIHMHADHFFGPDDGWIITVTDVWSLENPLLAEYNVASWVPIDHWTALGPQPNVRRFFEKTGALPIAMSRFGETQLKASGYDPIYIPHGIDTNIFKPTAEYEGLTGRELMTAGTDRSIPEDAFIVGMVAMNKGWARDRKGFNEAFWAFSMFNHDHPEANAYLYMHSDKLGGAEGMDLVSLARGAGVPEHKVIWGGGPGQYMYFTGMPPEAMAAMYTSMDVLLAPSHGEGFCIPLIEAQACGTPVIATNATAQTEMVPEGCGWLIEGQPEFDPAHHAWYKTPFIEHTIHCLENALEADRAAMAATCITHAKQYDADLVFEQCWKPFIADITAEPVKLELAEPREEMRSVNVLVPLHKRTTHIEPLVDSFVATTTGPSDAWLTFIYNPEDEPVAAYIKNLAVPEHVNFVASPGTTFAEKINTGYRSTGTGWLLVTGDDVRFHPGWLDAARKLSTEFDVIGTNDSVPPRIRNRSVAKGTHADHFFVRCAYVEEHGACLDGPGILAPEAYGHWYTDKEIIELAKARGVFTPCLESIVEHLHPGYDGNEAAREADPTYMDAVARSAADEQTFKSRVPLIQMQRTTRGRA